MRPTSQVIIRNKEMLQQGRWLIANAEDGALYAELSASDISGFHQYINIYEQVPKAQRSKHHFGAEYSLGEQALFDGVLIVLPKAKAHAQMLIANMACVVKEGGTLLLVGENKAGGKSAGKLLTPYGDNVVKQDSARHCSLFSITLTKAVPEFNLADYQVQFNVSVGDKSFPVVTLPGVFSHKELDAGTKLLLDNIERVPNGRILDFACGAGVIGTYIGLKKPGVAIVMSDISALALHCSAKTAELNNVQAQCVASDGLQAVEGTFNAIYTNPPFHTGVKTDYAITSGLFKQVKQHLRKPGQLLLVANRFLKYPEQIQAALGHCEAVAQTTKFSLYQAKVS